MPADDAGTASPVTPEAAPAQEAQAQEAQQQTQLKFNVGDVMRHLRVPEDVQKAVQPKVEEKKEEPEVPATQEPKKPPEDKIESEAEPVEEPTEEPKEEPEVEKEEEKEAETPKDQWPDSARKRVDKLTRQREEAKERAELAEQKAAEIEARLQATEPVVVAANGQDPLAYITNQAQLTKVQEEAKMLKRWARENAEGLILNEGKENERVISAKEMAGYLTEAEDVLTEHLPRRREQLGQRAQFDQVARTEFPALFDRSTPDYQAAQAILAEIPSLINHPARNFYLGVALEGYKVLDERKKAAGKNGAPEKAQKPDLDPRFLAKVPPIAEHTPNPPARTHAPTHKKKVEDAIKKVAETGGRTASVSEAVQAIFESRKGVPGKRELAPV